MNNNTTTTNNTNNNTILGGDNMNTIYNLSKELTALKENSINLKAKQIEEARHLFSTPERYNVTDIVVGTNNKKTVIKEQIVSLSENRLFAVEKADTKMVGLYKNKKRTNVLSKNHMSKFIQITFEDEDMAAKSEMNNFEIYYNESNGLLFLRNKGRFLELTEDKIYNKLPEGTALYKMLLSTAGDYKVSRALFYRKDSEKETYKTIIENVAPGFFGKMSSQLKVKEAAKKMPQMGLLKTTGKMATYLDNFIVYNSGILDTVSGMSDGYALVNAKYYMEQYNIATEAEACKIAEQDRMGNSQKFTSQTVQDELFKVKSNEIFDLVLAKTDNKVDDAGVTEYFDADGKLLMTVIGELDKATHIFDKNTTKGNVDYRYRINRGLTVMAVSHLSSGKLNSQVNESVFIAGAEQGRMDEVEAFYTDLFEEEMSRLIVDMLGAESKPANIDDNYALSILKSVCPNNPIVFKDKYSSNIDTMKNTISGLSFGLKFADGSNAAFNMLLSCDVSASYGIKVLTGDNVFCAGIARKISKMGDEYDNRFDRAIITKAPKMGVYEYKNAHFMSFDEVEERINSLDISDDMKRMLVFKFNNSPNGVIYFPSDDKEYAKLAGSDNDGDKVQVYFNEFLTGLLTRNFVVNIDTSKETSVSGIKSQSLAEKINAKLGDITKIKYSTTGEYVGKMLTVDEQLVGTVFMMNVNNKMSIGLITFYNNKIVAALTEALCDNLEPAKKFLSESGISEGYEDRELIVDDTFVNEKFAKTLREEMNKVIWNKQNIINFLLYCNEIFRLYQEGAIDATKTGIYLDMIFKCDSVSIERLYGLTTEGSGVDKKIVRNVTYKDRQIDVTNIDGSKTKLETMHFVDRIGSLENKFIDRVNEEFKSIVDANLDLFRYTKEQMVDFKYTLDEVNTIYPEVLSQLYVCKRSYVSIMMDRSSKEELTQEERDGYNFEIESLSNAVRALIDKMDFSAYSDREKELTIAELLLGVGCSWSPNRMDDLSANKFAYTVCPEYAFAYFVNGRNYTAECNVVDAGMHLDGQSVSISRGVSAYGLLTDSRYTGEVVISDDKAYTQKSFGYTFVDESKAMLIFKKDEEMNLTRNSSVAVGEDGNVYFYSDVTTGCDETVVGKMSTSKLFTGEVESDYYIDGMNTVTINTRVDNDFMDIEYTVVYLTK